MKHQPTINIHNQDCMEAMAKMEDNAFELAIVDPPYGLQRFKKGGSHVNKYGSENQRWNNIKPGSKYFNELFRVSKEQIIWGGNNFDLPTSEYFIIWQKSNAQDFSFAMCEMAWTNCKIPAKIFQHLHVKNKEQRLHPTQKPIALYKWLLKNYANEGDKILDTHLGSGSIAIACHDMGFDLEAYEIDQEYYQAALQRLNTHRSQLQMF